MARAPLPHDHQHTLAAEPNVTPMIDVMLVLLITFMMLVSVRQTITAQLPAPRTDDVRPGDTTPLVLTVAAGPRYTLNRQPVAADTLARTLRHVFAPRPDKVLFIAGQPGATYQQVITAMDVARGAGVRVIGLAPRSITGSGRAARRIGREVVAERRLATVP